MSGAFCGEVLDMKFISTAELKRDTNKLIRANEQGEVFIVTRHGKPRSILQPIDENNLEQVLFEKSPVVREAVLEGLADLKEGRKMSLAEYVSERKKRKNRTITSRAA